MKIIWLFNRRYKAYPLVILFGEWGWILNAISGSVSLVAFVALFGCATPQEQKAREAVLADPNLSAETRQLIKEKKIRVGMTKDQVVASWGSPCGYCYGTRKTSNGDSWEYNVFGTGRYGIGAGTYLYFDNGGRLIYWSK